MKFLIVDDNKDNLYLLKTLLNYHGYYTEEAENGAEALKKISEELPDIIISDILMPIMDGYQFCYECKNNEIFKNIYFIFYTSAYISDENEKFAYKVGCDTYLKAPYEPELLINVILEEMKKAKSQKENQNEIEFIDSSSYFKEYSKIITSKLEQKTIELENEILKREHAEELLKQKLLVLSKYNGKSKPFNLSEIFDIEILMNIHNNFIKTYNVLSHIIDLKGNLIFKDQYISDFCKIICSTEEGIIRCICTCNKYSNYQNKTLYTKTYCCSYFEKIISVSIPIFIGDVHVANWCIAGLVSKKVSKIELRKFAKEIEVDPNELIKASEKIPLINEEQLLSIINFLSSIIKNISLLSFQNIHQAKEIIIRAKSEIAYRESEKKHKSLISNIKDIVYEIDSDYKWSYLSPVIEGVLGYKSDEIISKPFTCIFDPENAILVKKTIENAYEKFDFESILINSKGYKKHVVISGKIIRNKKGKYKSIIGTIRDTTEMKKIEDELIKSQRLEGISIIASGIAHDFNNSLMSILGCISVAKMKINSGSDTYKTLSNAEEFCLKTRRITQQLVTFSKNSDFKKKSGFIHKFIKKIVEFTLSGSSVKSEFSFEKNLPIIQYEETHITQVFENLTINSTQAMPDGGIIKISIKVVYLDKFNCMDIKKGNYINISFKDSGVGIKRENLKIVFDPFFTTKKNGSGLGLASVKNIIIKHNGYIFVESEVGIGTEFNIYLPVGNNDIKDEDILESELFYGSGKVLLMDDDENVKNTTKNMIKQLGYDVITASNGNEIVKIFKETREEGQLINVFILDLTIPGGMGGEKTLKELIKIDPDVKVIISSGYSDKEVIKNYKEYGFAGYIHKPYSLYELSSIINKVIQN